MDPFLMVDLESTWNNPTDTNVTTTQSPPSHDENDSLFIIIPVVILILVILSLMVYFMIKRRRLVKLKRDILAMYQFDPCEEEWESLSNSFNNHNTYGTRNHSGMTSTKNSRTSSKNSLEETTSL